MTIDRSSNFRRLATAGAAALALVGCDPDSKPDAKVAEVDRARTKTAEVFTSDSDRTQASKVTDESTRARMLATCLREGASKYHPLYRLIDDKKKGKDPRFSQFIKHGEYVATADMLSCNVRVSSSTFNCYDRTHEYVDADWEFPNGVWDWIEDSSGLLYDRERTFADARWPAGDEKCDRAYNSILTNFR